MGKSNLDRALAALNSIPPDLSRDQWVKVGMALHAAGGEFDDFDLWSGGGASYDPSECYKTWRSFKKGKGIGAGTLFAIAREYGYRGGTGQSAYLAQAGKAMKPHAMLRDGVSAAEVWKRCEPATTAHPYIAQKNAAGIPLDRLRVLPLGDTLRIAGENMGGSLVIPVMRTDGTLSSLQFIAMPEVQERLKANGKPGKLNLPGTQLEGWHVVGEIERAGVAYVCEGIGTAWACWQSTGAASVVCFGWGRVSQVAAQLRERYPSAGLVIVPDVGKETEAKRIAAAVSGLVASMPEGWEKNSDAGDLAQRDGLEAVQAMLEAASEPPTPPPLLKPVSVSDVLTNPAAPPQFVWEKYLPRGVVSMLGAHGGTGKSTIALMLAVCSALGRPLFGIETVRCKTLFVSLEDGMHIVRHRLARICHHWEIDPKVLEENLRIVDGTEYPELFAAESRTSGDVTATYFELHKIVKSQDVGLVVVDNASDAYGGDEIQRRQVRAFIRTLMEIARLTNCAVLLLAHVDKNTSKARKAEGGEGYSGSTAWHNSVRSRLFMTRSEIGTLMLEHQKSNLGQCREPVMLEWPDAGLPQLVGNSSSLDDPLNPFLERAIGRAEDELAIKVLRMIAEFETRQQYCSPIATARNNVFAMLKSESAFQKLKLNADGCKRIVNQCQRAKWLEPVEYRTHDRKTRARWTLTTEGRAIAGLSAPRAPCAPCTNESAESAGGAPCAPFCTGGVGEERAHPLVKRVTATDGMEKSNDA